MTFVSRQEGQTASIFPNSLSYKKTDMRVFNGEIKKGGFFYSDYLQYTVEIKKPMKSKVIRKDPDFYALRKILTK